MANTLRPQKTALLVAQRIVRDIDRLGHVPGDRLPPERLMLEKYKIGRGTLRESLRYLELQGIISLKPGPGGGPIIQSPDASSLSTSLTLLMHFGKSPYRTIAEARVGLEPVMAQLAASRIKETQLKDLAHSLDVMESGLEDEEAFLESNRQFHNIIAHASGNSIFGVLLDALVGMLDGTAIGIDYPTNRREAVLKAHHRVFTAIASHDADAAEETMLNHMVEYARYAERKFPELFNSPIVWTPCE